ncbi:MAG TPA: malto-oligosyltrehalose trehalohydrolase [Polyangiaceae bacterium]|nr:malto-oligosyltrehalose trehalohydrolase [Polyangiaceae bacterium]
MTTTSAVELGAHPRPGGVVFGVFARAESCQVEVTSPSGEPLATLALQAMGDGYHRGFVPGIGEGARYWFVVNGKRLPDPCARSLPDGVHGAAQVVASHYAFRHRAPVRPLAQQVIYELHIGTFTEAGTFAAARERLPELAELGITTLELMPLAAFAGEHGWGYDGVALFAPHAAYGSPDELRELVDTAHGLGLNVLLDVVYNHFGPAGNYLSAFSPSYFRDDVRNAWGSAVNFEEPALRRLVLDNARYWLSEFQLDGLRLDATHAITDGSPTHILRELVEVAAELRPPRILIAEDERNRADLVSAVGLDGLWADDFHHQVRVTLTGESAGYYAAYDPSAQGIADAINRGWLYTGQVSPVTGQARGTPAQALAAESLVYCIQNHDQVGNRALGDRFPLGEEFLGASLLLLFLPMTPLLFMGQEWGASSPFLYFTDHDAELGRLVTEGRRREFAAFHEHDEPGNERVVPDPQARDTFLASKLRWSERTLGEHARALALYRAALQLRHTDPVLRGSTRAELSAHASEDVLIVQRWLGNERRALVFNLARRELSLADALAPSKLSSSRILLRSSPAADLVLPPFAAVVVAGQSDAAGTEASS